MPKYYIRDDLEQAIIDAPDAETAVVKCIKKNLFSTVMIGGWYWVSERTFGVDQDAIKVFSNNILDRL